MNIKVNFTLYVGEDYLDQVQRIIAVLGTPNPDDMVSYFIFFKKLILIIKTGIYRK
jgi:hypothetical protein